MKWLEGNRVGIAPPRNPKRITGTRFAGILEMDRWSTPFKMWCAITRTYEEPFVDNKYTIAGKTIEPKVVDYLNKVRFFGTLKTPTDIYGEDYFKKTWGNFFPKEYCFGGMWDALEYDKDGNVKSVIEIKTTGRSEDWADGKAPDHYALQACLYAHLLGIDKVVMVCSFLEEEDYVSPEAFQPSVANTIIDEFRIYDRYPQFKKYVDYCVDWWDEHVVGGVSPEFCEHRDAEILKELRKNTIDNVSELKVTLDRAEELKGLIEEYEQTDEYKEYMSLVKELKDLTEKIRTYCMDKFRDGDTRVAIEGQEYEWVLLKSTRETVDKEALVADGLGEKYISEEDSFRFTQSKLKK